MFPGSEAHMWAYAEHYGLTELLSEGFRAWARPNLRNRAGSSLNPFLFSPSCGLPPEAHHQNSEVRQTDSKRRGSVCYPK